MIVLVLTLVAVAAAAPCYHPNQYHGYAMNYHRPPANDNFFSSDVFDTRSFWSQLETELKQLDEVLKEFTEHFPALEATAGVVGNEYKITIPLSGYNENEITVAAKEGLLMVQAVHKMGENSQRSYLDMKTLPRNIEVTGSWQYEKNLLTIVFPLKVESTTEAVKTTVRESSREEIEKNDDFSSNDLDVDVGLKYKTVESPTTKIPASVEATTYSVDFSGDVKFVPMHF